MAMLNALQSQKSPLHKIFPILFAICLLGNFCYHLSLSNRMWFVDLRNRVTGARLMDKDISPYYFKWNASYPTTLYDPTDRCDINNNMTTSPPSILWMMQPLSRLSYINIGRIWLCLEYFAFFIIFISFYRLFKDPLSRMFISIAGILLLFSGQWVNCVVNGQLHFLQPAFLGMFFLLSQTKWRYRFLTIGLLLSLLVWVRPNILVLVPFLFLCKETNWKQLAMGIATGGVLLTGLTLLLHQVPLWLDFYRSCQEWAFNNVTDYKYLPNLPCEEHILTLEGKEVHPAGLYIFHADSEVFVLTALIKSITGIELRRDIFLIPVAIFYTGMLLLCVKKQLLSFHQAILTGLFFYWLFEVAAPISKLSYYYLELFVVVYYLAGKFNQLHKPEKIMLLLSMLFLFLDFVPINMIIAELLTVGSLVVYLTRTWFTYRRAGTTLS